MSIVFDQPSNNDETEASALKSSHRHHLPFTYMKHIMHLNRPEWPYMAIGIIASLLVGIIEPAVGLLYSIIYGLLAESDFNKQAYETRAFALSIFGIYVAGGCLQWLITTVFAKCTEELTRRVRVRSFVAILRQEMNWFDQAGNNISRLISLLGVDAGNIKGLTAIRFGKVLISFGLC